MRHDVTTGVQPSTQQPRGVSSGGELWVEKHKPKHSRELVGNNTLIATLRQWLETWCASTAYPLQMGVVGTLPALGTYSRWTQCRSFVPVQKAVRLCRVATCLQDRVPQLQQYTKPKA